MKKMSFIKTICCFVIVQAILLLALSPNSSATTARIFRNNSVINQPKITRLSPALGAPGTEVTIIGSGFYTDTTVSVGSVVVPATLKPNDRALVIKIPDLSPGNVTIIVNNPGAIVASTSFSVLPPLVFNQPTIPQVEAGQSLSVQLSASGGRAPYTFSNTTSLPPGVSLSAAGVISGAPTQAGSYATSLVVTDTNHLSVAISVSFSVTPGPSVTTQTLPDVTQGNNFVYDLSATGGTPPYSWSIAQGAIPGGLLLTSEGLLEGKPGVAGQYKIYIKVTDAIGASQTVELPFLVSAPPPPPQSVVLVSRGGRFGLYNSSTALPASIQTTGHLPGVTVAVAGLARSSSYFAVNSVGKITCLGAPRCFRSLPRRKLKGRIVAAASNDLKAGYWLLSGKGFIYAGGYAKVYNSFSTNIRGTTNKSLLSFRQEIFRYSLVGIAPSPGGRGYWVVSSNGAIWGFGTAKRLIPLNLPLLVRSDHSHITAIESAKVGMGFYVVLADGQVLSFGSAVNYGSLSNKNSRNPVVALVVAPGGKGYWLLTKEGQLTPFGSAANLTFAGGLQLNNGVIGAIAIT